MTLGYLTKEIARPKWFTPLLVGWVLTGLPNAIFVPYLWISGVAVTEAPPPSTGLGGSILEVFVTLLVALFVFGSPIALSLAERNYRRRLHAPAGKTAHAPN